MLKAILMLGLGVAAVGVARFARNAITEEHGRRRSHHEAHDTTRWEGEGGNVVHPATAAEV